jgi:octaprenyl-diphosphate synthase
LDVATRPAFARKPPSLDGLLELAAPDMAAIDALIRRHMESPVPVIPALADHLIAGSAKRLRPLLTVAAARLAGARDDACLKLAGPDMSADDALIREHMDSPVPLIPALADHLNAG